jgi:hypothetical protein
MNLKLLTNGSRPLAGNGTRKRLIETFGGKRMKTIVSTALLLLSLVFAGCGKPDTTSVRSKSDLTQLTDISREQAIDLARQKGREMNIPIDERTPQVKEEGAVFVVEFPPPPNARAGSWIFKIDRASGKIVETKIWR